jgi:hypothetical protein
MNFYLKQLPTGRIYLSQIEPTASEVLIEVIDAEHWIAARETTQPHGLERFPHRYGYGFYKDA